jgi:hypothetical protein
MAKIKHKTTSGAVFAIDKVTISDLWENGRLRLSESVALQAYFALGLGTKKMII